MGAPNSNLRGRRPPLLIALQSEATILMSLSIGQAGLAAGFLTGTRSLKAVHAVNAIVIAALTVAILITALAYRRAGGPRWIVLAAAVVAVVEALQISLGKLHASGAHIFLGVLFVTITTLLTSYLFRPGFVPRHEAPTLRRAPG